jgi:hypothetical protein
METAIGRSDGSKEPGERELDATTLASPERDASSASIASLELTRKKRKESSIYSYKRKPSTQNTLGPDLDWETREIMQELGISDLGTNGNSRSDLGTNDSGRSHGHSRRKSAYSRRKESGPNDSKKEQFAGAGESVGNGQGGEGGEGDAEQTDELDTKPSPGLAKAIPRESPAIQFSQDFGSEESDGAEMKQKTSQPVVDNSMLK